MIDVVQDWKKYLKNCDPEWGESEDHAQIMSEEVVYLRKMINHIVECIDADDIIGASEKAHEALKGTGQ